MKKYSIALLIVLLFSVSSPLTITQSSNEEVAYLVALDVCSGAGSAVSVNADSPAIQEWPCKTGPAGFSGYVELIEFSANPSVLSFTDERPPKV
jgi:hypothetical protein